MGTIRRNFLTKAVTRYRQIALFTCIPLVATIWKNHFLCHTIISGRKLFATTRSK